MSSFLKDKRAQLSHMHSFKLYIPKVRLLSSRLMIVLNSFLNKAEQTMEGKTYKWWFHILKVLTWQ